MPTRSCARRCRGVARLPASATRACTALLGMALAAAPLLAQPANEASPAQVARKAYSIPSGPLAEALNRFAREAGVLLSFQPALAEGRHSQLLEGDFSIADGFATLLAGTGLQAVLLGDGSYAVQVLPVQLPVVKVIGQHDVLVSEDTGRYGHAASNTATRLELSARETPQSVSVVTRTQMNDFGLFNANDVLANTTGVHVDVVETDRTYFSSRGFDISNFQVDGVGMPFTNGDQLGDIDTAVFDRVEVLRGANGLLSATGNPAATVNYVRKRPTRELRAAASGSLGSWNKRRLDGDLAGPLNATGSVRGRVILAGQRADSFMQNYSLDKTVAAGLLEAEITARTRLMLGSMRQENRPQGTAWGGLPLNDSAGNPTDYPRSTAAAPRWSHWDNTDTTTFAELSHRVGDWQAKAVLSHRKMGSDGKLFSISGALPDPVTGAGTESWLSTQVAEEKQTLLDVHATGPITLGGRRHELVVGAHRAKIHNQAAYQRGAGNSSPMTGPDDWAHYPEPEFNGATGSADFTNRRESLYALARWNLADPLKLFTGLNVTHMESDGLGFRSVPRTYSETKAQPYLGAVLDLDANHSLYASYARIFNPQTQVDADGQLLGPVEGDSVEVGVKGEWFSKRLHGSASLFRARQDNTAEFAGFSTFSYFRGINATSTGIEFDLAGQLAPAWEISAGYTHLRLLGDDGRDTRTFVPRRIVHLGTSYRVPALPGLKLGATLRWQSDIWRVNQTQQTAGGEDIVRRQGAYALLGLAARYDFSERFNAALTVNNVTDRKYLASLYWDQSLYGAPRNATVTLNATY